ncbi:DUF6491 family protein [Sphingomonas sp. NFR15]|uniref:DUF6491 family protein n=1 Tax=Sphingomonas sp. NFR15 TaxID=1566282 RepID=UPI000891F42F|nr:DUF6491 family protein [Sphingomonas sp. NFR15]SDA26969.1 hypothetical protein SAMN03159340_02089 [Sphingomonas sp. NFR15]
MQKAMLLAAAFVLSPSAALADAPADARLGGWTRAEIGKEASIPFIRDQRLYGFESDGDRGVWLQDQRRRWYYAKPLGRCAGLGLATMIGVDSRFNGDSFDRTGTLLVDGQRCPLSSLTASEGPPPKPGKLKPGLNRIKRG